ncbi:hypothetical protein CIW49_21730 [Mycolicibacterium sp. P1-18]|uniref:dicarboxylate/amino acid:cation symporter n=1 Tax=Mycolicibacterium sp. P1-18 TaxID=2024615 RepID=UPI0011F3F177|nr:dicarboxylate/amino acid:cation symporter [Mycolicibacterium sp. P1-18]KAA0096135.1 hypothetical protein CIW49_21730 [Mycolicibacterium sp. P1-18]
MNGLQPWHWLVLLAFVLPFVFGLVSANIAKKKNRSEIGFLALGFFFGVIGLVVALVVSPGQPKPPPGMRGVTCPRCNARQYVWPNGGDYECWQCRTRNPLAV